MEARSAKSDSPEPTVWPVSAIVKVFQDNAPPAQPARPASRLPAMTGAAAACLAEPAGLAAGAGRGRAAGPLDGNAVTDISVGVVGYVPVDHPTNYYNSKSPAWHRKVPERAGPIGRLGGLVARSNLATRHVRTRRPGDRNRSGSRSAVPKDAMAGDYRGKVRFVVAGTTEAQMPFDVHVWDFTLPDEMHVKAIFDSHQHEPIWAVPGKTFEQVRRNFWRFLAQRRVCPDRIEPRPILRYEQGRVIADFKAFDEAADFYFNTLKLPHSYTPARFLLLRLGLSAAGQVRRATL